MLTVFAAVHPVSQDLSVAGKRKGLAGERSGLFLEQIRIIKEMRANHARIKGADEPVRPRYVIWENVKGCLSSPGKNRKGEDFRAVLTEFVRIVEEGAPDVPMPEKRNWKHAGVLYGMGADGNPFSIAWRLHDAQYHGVPQRRSRMCVLCDYGGYSAGEILFDVHDGRSAEADYKDILAGRAGTVERYAAEISAQREGVSGDSEQGETAREEAAGDVGKGIDMAITFQERGGCPGGGKGILIQTEKTGALSTLNNQRILCVLNDQGGSVMSVTEDVTACLRGQEHGHPPVVVLESNQNHATVKSDGVCNTLPAAMGEGGGYVPMVAYGVEPGAAQRMNPESRVHEEICPTLRAEMGDNQASVAYCIQGNIVDRADTAKQNGVGVIEDCAFTLNEIDRPAVCAGFDGNMGAKAGNIGYEEECSPTLNAGKQMDVVVYDARGNGDGETVPTLRATTKIG